MIKQGSRNNSPAGRLINLETGNEVKKTVFISAPYFPGLSEFFKQLFRYTHIQVCLKGQNTIKSMLMHPKDKVILPLKRMLCINGLAVTQAANLLTLGRPPGHSVNMSKNIAGKGPTLPHTNIVTPKAIHSPTLINSKL